MRKPNSQETICVNCPQPPTSLNNNDPTRVPNGTTDHHQQPNQRTNQIKEEKIDVSQAIADKMLAGWTLTAEHCPQCSTPLVRNGNGTETKNTMYCVSCRLPVIYQEGETDDGTRTAAAANVTSTTTIPEITPPKLRIKDSMEQVLSNLTLRLTATSQHLVTMPILPIQAGEKMGGQDEGKGVLEEMRMVVDLIKDVKELLSL